MRYRVPAGVRVAGKSYGGRFVSLAQLEDLLNETDADGRAAIFEYAAYELDDAAAVEQELNELFDDDPALYGRDRHDAELTRGALERLADHAAEDLADVEDMAPEWEIGFEYEGGGTGGPASHSFDLNIRIAREDGGDMGRREMLDVLRDFRRGLALELSNPVPVGYLIAAMAWRQTGRHTKGWVSSRDAQHDLTGSLAAPLMTSAGNDSAWTRPTPAIRAGSVRRL